MIVAGWCKWPVMLTMTPGKQTAAWRERACLSHSPVRAGCHCQLDWVVNPLGDNVAYAY